MIKEFLNYLQYERNRSALTVKSYGEDARAFESYFKNLDTHLSWESVDSDIIRDWMESMMDKGNTAASINRRLSAVRSLYRFALSRGFVEHDPSRGVFGPKKNLSLPYFLREEEMDRLLDPGRWSDAYGDVCLRTMLMVFYETGVRLSELTGLDNASVDLANSELKVTGKRNKQRVIPFGDELRETLCTYIYKRDAEVSGVDGVEDAFSLLQKDEDSAMLRSDKRSRPRSRLSVLLKNVRRTCCGIRSPQQCSIMMQDWKVCGSCSDMKVFPQRRFIRIRLSSN